MRYVFHGLIVLLLLTNSGCDSSKKTGLGNTDSANPAASLTTSTELLANGGMEVWTNPTTLTHWTLVGTGATSAQKKTKRMAGTYSARVTAAGVSGYIEQDLANPKSYRNKTLFLGSWVYATGDARLLLRYSAEGVNTDAWAFHSSNPGWEYLTAITKIGGTATQVSVILLATPGVTALFDDASLSIYKKTIPADHRT